MKHPPLMKQRTFVSVTQFSGLQLAAHGHTLHFQTGAAANVVTAAANQLRTAGAAFDVQSVVNTSGEGGIVQVSKDTLLVSPGTGNPELVEVGVTGFMALKMSNGGDDIRHLMAVPSAWDRNHPIRVRVLWSSEAAAVGDRTIDWKVLYRSLTPGDAILAPVAALDTPIPVGSVPTGVTRAFETTGWGVLNGHTIPDDALAIALCFEMDAHHVSFTESKFLLGAEFEYSPRVSRRSMLSEAQPWTA
ncbi:MAG: hypothetical protein JW741_19925 [Sedimentisphaerales bacterium]|nr:hypothetical protein [Sedimentisphaerales bacterium]